MQQHSKGRQFKLVKQPFNFTKLKLGVSDKHLIESLKKETESKKIDELANEFFRRYVNYVYKISMKGCNQDIDEAKDLTIQTFGFALADIKEPTGFILRDAIPLEKHNLTIKIWLGNIAKFTQMRINSEKISGIQVKVLAPGIDEIICPVCSDFLQNDKKRVYCVKGHYAVKTDKKRFAEKIQNEPSDPPRDTFGKPLDSEETDNTESIEELRNKFNAAKGMLSDRERVIYDAYLDEGCIGNNLHLKDSTMQHLCKKYNTNPANIRQIKLRTIKKIKIYCLQI